MTSLPSGTVTFLFTDIELSTQTMEAMGNEAYADALDTHRQLLREVFKAREGHEVGTEGDSFFVAFAQASDAVHAALEGQEALRGHPLRVRMGMHTGEALVRLGEYVGHDVHKAKRVSDAGHGGQVLVSQTTADLVAASVDLVDLGPHRLKDLEEAQRLFQVGAGDFPPLRSLEAFTNNLPLQRSSFVGRENEIATVRKLLDEHRIVTLTGVGGSGKTRLALQVGAELLDAYPDGVFFADLAPVSDSGGVVPAVATAVGVSVSDAATGVLAGAVDQILVDFLARRNCLVLLDNCEHLLDACANLADRILSACPGVTLLATSREGLEIEGERAFTVPSMSVPDDAGAVETSEAVSLFTTRAAEVRPEFVLTPANAGAVASICRRLDGIPLAIEFAASRVSHLTPHEIDEHLRESFRLLAGGRRRVQRQQTIAATLDWSHDLLTEPERTLLRRLAVFPGGFTLDAAEGICADEDLASQRVLDLLGSLVSKSLLNADRAEERSRYRLLETVRLYASDKLKDAGESETFHARHRDWFVSQLEAIPWDHVLTSTVVMRWLDGEHANIVAALEWSVGDGRPDLVVRIVARSFMLTVSHAAELHHWATFVRPEDVDVDAETRVAALTTAGQAAVLIRSPDSVELRERAIAAGAGRASAPLAMAIVTRGLTRSVEAAFTRDPETAERCRREIDDAGRMAAELSPFTSAMIDYVRGFAEITMGNFDRAVGPIESAMRHADPDHHESILLAMSAVMASLTHAAGDDAAAARHARWVVDHMDAWPAWGGPVAAAAAAFAGAGDVGRAASLLVSRTDIIRRSGMPPMLDELLVGYAAVLAIKSDHARAARLLAWVRAQTIDQLRPLGSPVSWRLYVHYVPVVREALGAEPAAIAREQGRAMSEDEAVTLAIDGLGSHADD